MMHLKEFKPEDEAVAREVSKFRKANIGLSGKSGKIRYYFYLPCYLAVYFVQPL